MSETQEPIKSETLEEIEVQYYDAPVRWFIWASIIWGIVGMLVGALAALQLAHHQANIGEYLSFGRIRPLHTNAVIFAFVGNMMFAGVYYSSMRLLKTDVFSRKLTKIHFWGWQLIIVAAAITLPLGMTQAKEYAELEWPIDIAIAVVWVVFAINFFGMIAKRNERQLYVAIWFYIATIVTVAMLHIVNSLAIPVALGKSYSIFGGVQDALVQWWYGHNAVAFFLTTPILGIMYYFIPKAANRPVYSYRLSIVHFWALVFLYIWAGPHHLLNTALPGWAQSLGMIFSLMLWAPSWGGMLNGLLTLKGAWDKLRRDPVLKFFAAGVTFYGMSTFEGPLLSIKAVSGLAHYTDWIIGHVHAGALGWNGFMAAGMFYWLIPRLYGVKLYSIKNANAHFWIGTIGILMYVISMWVAGITQGLMWREDAGRAYPFIETLLELRVLYWARLLGGTMYLVGMFMMFWNLIKTARSGRGNNHPVNPTVRVTTLKREATTRKWYGLLFSGPVLLVTALITIVSYAFFANTIATFSLLLVSILIGIVVIMLGGGKGWHGLLEGKGLAFSVLTVVAVIIGGAVQLIPTIVNGPQAIRGETNEPYTALELEGRDVYLKEGCYNCHSQMIRPFTWEVNRYGPYSRPEESAYDHPFQWGSKRTGPDLARVGTRVNSLWHYQHMIDPRATSEGSNMPPYPHLAENTIDFGDTETKMRRLRAVGVPYRTDEIHAAQTSALGQAKTIADEIREKGLKNVKDNSELIALIAYLNRLGTFQPKQAQTKPALETE